MAGRPTQYKTEYNEQVYKLCLLGADDKKIADFFNIQESTLNLWKKKHPEFMESIKRGKEIADFEIANSLYQKAKGYKRKAIQFATFQGQITDREEYIEDIPPDTAAAIFWLKNRQKNQWRDKTEQEITNKTPSIVVANQQDAELITELMNVKAD
jgi:hypothetical protein